MTGFALPTRFRDVRYDGTAVPDGDHDLRRGANCQRFAYALLAEAGLHVPPLRSSELWADERHTRRVPADAPEPLDLLLFNRTADAWGAHVAVYVGEGRAAHLCRAEGRPAVWLLADFPTRERYAVLVGVKRARPPASPSSGAPSPPR